MASTDSRPVPLYNTAFRVYFGIYTAAGALQSAAASLAARVIQDGTDGAAANSVTEIGTTGVYYLDLNAAEMDTDCTVVKVTATDTVPVVIALYPQNTGDIKTDIQSIGGGNTAGIAAMRRAFENMTVVTIATGSTSTSVRTDLTEATPDHYKGRPLYFLTGTLAGQIVEIIGYAQTNGALTVTATPTGESPGNGDLALIA